MRNAEEIIKDLGELSPIEWNSALAKEYDLSEEEFIKIVSAYNYTVLSEDNIHHKMKPVYAIISEKLTNKPIEDNKSIKDIIKISSVVRDVGGILFELGDVLDQMIFCGFVMRESQMSALIIKNCIFNNCTMVGTNFQSTRFIQCKFIDCDFSGADFSSSLFIKCQFFENNFRNATCNDLKIYDGAFYNCELFESDFDGSSVVNTLIHGTSFVNGSFKNIDFLSTVITYCDFKNSSLKNSSFLDCNLISIDLRDSTLNGLALVGTYKSALLVDAMYSDLFEGSSDDSENSDSSFDDGDEDSSYADD